MQYIWDPRKNRKNIRKHKLSFDQVIPVLQDSYTVKDVYDKKHSKREHRYKAFGYLPSHYYNVVICYIYRAKDVIRVISARKV